MHGVHLRMCISLGALIEDRSKISASWAAMDFKRLMAVRSSEHLTSRALSSASPGPNGAPRRLAFSELTTEKPSSEPVGCRWSRAITSHSVSLRRKPILIPYSLNSWTSSDTSLRVPPSVISSINPMVRGEVVERRIGWMARQNRRPPKGSPC